MRQLAANLDDLLRGRWTRESDLSKGKVEVRTASLLVGILGLGAICGAFMGLYSVLRTDSPGWAQLAATTMKVPLLFLLTLLVTYPSLYVVSALFDSKLDARGTLRLLLAATATNLALLASLGPVIGFFTLSTESYPFLVVLNVVFFGASGLVGLAVLRRALAVIYDLSPALVPLDEVPKEGEFKMPGPGAPAAVRVFSFWLIIYGAVGAQMSWVLRPFLGDPELPFQLFRERESNFFAAVLRAIEKLGA